MFTFVRVISSVLLMIPTAIEKFLCFLVNQIFFYKIVKRQRINTEKTVPNMFILGSVIFHSKFRFQLAHTCCININLEEEKFGIY